MQRHTTHFGRSDRDRALAAEDAHLSKCEAKRDRKKYRHPNKLSPAELSVVEAMQRREELTRF